MPNYPAKGPLNSVADLVVANELRKIWNALEVITGQTGNATDRAVTLAELNKMRSDLLTRFNKTTIPGFRQDFVGEVGVGGGGGAIFYGPDPPANPANYLAWWNTEEGALKVYYHDPNTTQWVDAMPARTGAGYSGTGGGGGSGIPPVTASYVVLDLNADLTQERKLVAGSNITLTDGGPGGTLTISTTAQAGPTPYWVTVSPKTPPTSPSSYNEEWNDASGMSGVNNGLAAAWTTFGAAQTRNYNNGCLVLTGTGSGGTTPNLTGIYKTAPSTPYTVTVEVAVINRTVYGVVGVGLRRGSTGKFVQGSVFCSTAPETITGAYSRYDSPTSRAASTNFTYTSRMVWLRMKNDGTNWVFSLSPTGIEGTYTIILTEALSTHFGANLPDQFCLTLDPFDPSTPYGQYGPVRVT